MPDWRAEVRARIRDLQLAPPRELAIVDELAQDLSEREAALLRDGATPDEAYRLVLSEIEDHNLLRRGLQRAIPPTAPGSTPAVPRVGFRPGDVAQDLRYALRTLIRDRVYSLTSLLALAIGIGGAAAVFGALDAVLLRPMPFPHADRLVIPVSEHAARGIEMGSTSYADYVDWRAQPDIFAAVAAWQPWNVDLTGDAEPERVEAITVSEEYFSLIDVMPLRGRTLQPADHSAEAPRVVVIAHGLWQRRFGGEDVVGRTVRISGVPHQVVGILPPRSVWPDTGQVFLPLRPATLHDDERTRRDNLVYQALARLREGVAIDQGDARLAVIAARLAQDDPASRAGWTNRLVPLREYIVDRDVRLALWVLLGAVVSVLIIACANVANLALVRGQARARELAIRLSLGASRGRLVQQLVTECAVLAAVAAGSGAALAAAAMRGLAAIAPDGTPFVDAIAFDARVVLAMSAIVVLVIMVTGLMPALVTSGLRVSPALKDGSPGSGVSARTIRMRHALVVAEVAAAVMLLVTSALLLRSFTRLVAVDPGVQVDRVLTARLSLPAARYEDEARVRFHTDLAERLTAHQSVEGAAAASFVPAGGGGFGLGRVFVAEGRPEPPAAPDLGGQWNVITPDYFKTVGIRLMAGRPFTDADRANATPVIIVSELFAQRMFPDGAAIGRRIRSWRDENVLREIVGVVADVRYWGLSDAVKPLVYVPYAQDTWGPMVLVIRARGGDPHTLAPVLRSTVASLDNQVALARVAPLAEAAADSIAAQRYATMLVGVLAAIAIVLASLGVYGVISYLFTMRRREIGIRLALGASVASVYALVFRYGFGLVGLGLAIGALAAAAASRWLATLLFETPTTDLAAWAAMIGAVLLATAIACVGPARRSASADPVSVLRAE